MLVLFETAAGHALFKVQDEGKLSKSDDIYQHFETSDKANDLYVIIQNYYRYAITQ